MNPMYFVNEIIWIYRTVPLRRKLVCTPVRTPLRVHVHTPVRSTPNARAQMRMFSLVPLQYGVTGTL